MNTKSTICTVFVTTMLLSQQQLSAQEKTRHTLPDDSAKAWAEVEKVHQALTPPDDWRTRQPTAERVADFQKQVRQTAKSFADKAREFIQRFPTNENLGDARITVVHALLSSVVGLRDDST